MEIANRMTAITGGETDGWDVFYKARQMKKAGISVTELTIGEHDIRTHPKILKEMNEIERVSLMKQLKSIIKNTDN